MTSVPFFYRCLNAIRRWIEDRAEDQLLADQWRVMVTHDDEKTFTR